MKKKLSFLFLLFGCFLNNSVLAQPELDITFNSTGKTVLYFGSSGQPQDMIVQPDNKMVFVGVCNNIGTIVQFCLIRLSEDGSFDPTFDAGQGHPGYVYTRVVGATSDSGGFGIALQNDGKIVVTGSLSGQIVLIRYNANGTLDNSFGKGGILQSTLISNAGGSKIIIQPDGKYVIVGSFGSPNSTQFVARFLPDGTPDSSFGNGGITTINIPGNRTIGLSIAIQADGKIVTGGGMATPQGDPNPSNSFLVARLNRDGTPDTTFDGDGLKTIPSGYQSSGFYYGIIRSVAVQSDGRILALGYTDLLFRFNTDGSLDTSFDDDGRRVVFGTSIPINGPNSETFDLTVTPSGKITVVGNPSTFVDFPNIQYIVARYLPNGLPDTSFSGDGFLSFVVNSSGWDGALTVAPDSQGRTVIGGRTSIGATRFTGWRDPLFSAARLIASPTQNAGISGIITKQNGKPVFNAAVTIKQGSQIVGYGRTNPFGNFRIPNLPSNKTYTLSVSAKNLSFSDRSVLVDGEITNFLVVSD